MTADELFGLMMALGMIVILIAFNLGKGKE
jgi:hypothetical protein